MRPTDLLRAHLDLTVKSGDRAFQHIVARTSLGPDRPMPPQYLEQLSAAMNGHARAAYVYRVAPDMVDLLEVAARGLDDTDRFDRSLAPTGAGLVRFDKALLFHEARGRIMRVNWLLWGPMHVVGDDNIRKPGMGLWAFNDVYDDPDEVYMSIDPDSRAAGERVAGRWGTLGVNVIRDGEPLDVMDVPLSEWQQFAIAAEGDTPAPATTNLTRYVHALWLLMNQTITSRERVDADRKTGKAMRRAKLPSQYTVIQLRRTTSNAHPGETHVEWNHRWVVRGHWAWRVCGEDHPSATPYKDGWGTRVWISPYVKGPEGKPLVITDKVYDLSR